MKSLLLCVLSFLHLCKGQNSDLGSDRRLIHRRPLHQQSSPCSSGGYSENVYDLVEDDAQGRKFLLVAGAAVGGAALGYHLGMKHKNPIIINNNIHNDYPSPCVAVQSGAASGGGGIIGGILSHHPILSNILQGGLWNGGDSSNLAGNRFPPSGTSGNRQSNINWNRAIRQFNRVVRPLTRGFR